MKFTSLTQRFMLWFVLLVLLPLLLIAYTLLQVFENELLQTVSRQVAIVADKKTDQIDAYLDKHINDVMLKGQTITVREAMVELGGEFARSGVHSAAYRGLDGAYRAYFQRFVSGSGHYDLFLISPQGNIVYSQTHESDFTTNLFSGPYRHSGLAKVTRSALNTLEGSISEFELYAPSGNAIAAFIAVPIMDKNKVEGVLAIQIDHRRVFQVLLDNTGMGVSGETVVARRVSGQEALALAPLKIDPDAALKHKIRLDNPQRAEPLARALNGERGHGLTSDYNGVPVIAAWRYLPILRAGIVTKIDADEALAPLYRVRNIGLGILALAMLAAVAAALLLGRRVVLPLQQLGLTVQDFAKGRLDRRAEVTGKDELGQLAVSFNAMADRLHAFYADLEGQVEQRTSELRRSVENVRIKEAAVEYSLNAIALADLEGRLFYVNQSFVDLWRLSGQADVLGRSAVEFWEKPEDAQHVMQVLQQHGFWVGELHARLHDGSKAILQVSANLVMDGTGKPLCMMASFVDISERVGAENALQRERDFASGLVETAPMIVLLLDTRGNIEYINPYFEKLGGYRLDEVRGKEWFSTFLPARDQDKLRVLFQSAAHDVPTRGNINPIVTRSGAEIEIEWNSQVMRDAQGKVVSILATGHDVTARKLMEQALIASSERLNEAQRIAKVGSWELDLLTGKLHWSDEIYRLFEIDPDKFSSSYEAFLNGIHPEDREMVNEAYVNSLKTRQPYRVTHRLLLAGGTVKWVEELCETDFDAAGKPLVSRGTVQDITRQKMAEDLLRESEARYSSVVAALAEGVVVHATDGSIVTANSAAEQILGLSQGQMMGLTPMDPRWRAIHEDGSPFPGEMHPAALTLRTGLPVYSVIMGVHKPDDSLTWISINSQPIFQAGETLPSSVVVSFVDISERKQYEELLKNTNAELEQRVEERTALLRAAKEEAEQANLSKSVFLTSMSHELRTPLNAILGYAQLMQMDESLPPSIKENAGEIRRAGDFLLSLMNDILDLSRIESGRLQLKLEVVPVSEVMNNCHAQNLQAAISRNITLHLAESCHAYRVYADQRAFTQVMNNLVSNSIKYNRSGGRVNVSCSMPEPGKVRISVMDTGNGIEPGKQAQLFQPFNRLGAEMSNIEGTGIGLVISRKLVEGMHGAMGVESIHGLGSTFWIELPLAGLPAEVPVGKAGSPRRSPRVLVAEDYAPNRNVLLLQLQSLGCEADIVANGAEALEKWRSQSYDLILTDIDMPVMNGIELARNLRDEERAKGGGRIPLVAITATSQQSQINMIKSAGIDEVLGKPVSMEALRTLLTGWFGEFAAKPEVESVQDKIRPADNSANYAVLDLNYLYQILGQVNLSQARILVDTFLRTAAEGLQSAGRQSGNPALVAKEMHKQKSSARTVGAMRYATLAAALEQNTRDSKFAGIGAALEELRGALAEVEKAAENLPDAVAAGMPAMPEAELDAGVSCHSALVVDDDLVVLQQVKAMLDALGVNVVLTAVNGLEALKVLAARGGAIEVLVCDLSMPEMDGVELIRRFGKTGFNGSLILISGADEKVISTVNNLAVLQGLRVLGQLHKPVSSAQLAILLARAADLPAQQRQIPGGPLVTKQAINAAMTAKEFAIWFQPKVDAASLQVVGMEALARWPQAGGKFIPPDSFITVAEREGLIGELSQLLVSLALEEAAKLYEAGFPLKIAINLSGTWLNDLSLPDFVLSKTRQAGLKAEDVILEVTETGVMEDMTAALDVLSRLRLKGFGLSIDDFGIGYSSFEQLGRIPFTEMKLDRSFVSKGVQDAASRAILESSMDMAYKLNLSTVAEGVETDQHLKLVRGLGCDLVQGYLIAKPMPLSDLLEWLEKKKSMKRKS